MIDVVRGRLDGEAAPFAPPTESIQTIERFLETLSLETLDSSDMEPRLVRLIHAIDHLKKLQDDLQKPVVSSARPSLPAAQSGARALRDWLVVSETEMGKGATLREIEVATEEIAVQRKSERQEILASVARQQTAAASADQTLQSQQWSQEALYHCWRLIDSLRVASGR